MGTTNAASEQAFQDEMLGIVREAMWSFLATADGEQPRVRVVHPVWDGFTAYIGTGPKSAKAKQIESNQNTEMFYWTKDTFKHLTVTGPGYFVTEQAEKQRVWELFKTQPEGYDPGMIWQGGPDETFGVLRIDPDRIEITGMFEQMQGTKPRVWRR
jgi:general stress protein 26